MVIPGLQEPKPESKGEKAGYKLTGNSKREIKTRATKQSFLRSLEENEGVIASAQEALKIPPRTILHWLDNDPQFNKEVQSIRMMQAISAEGQLLRIRKNGEAHRGQLVACIFTLKCLGKDLGWVEAPGVVVDMRRQEIYGLPTDVLRKVIRMAERKGRIGPAPTSGCTLPPPTEQKAQVIDVEATDVTDKSGLPAHDVVSNDIATVSKDAELT